jgi:hypothetical protein
MENAGRVGVGGGVLWRVSRRIYSEHLGITWTDVVCDEGRFSVCPGAIASVAAAYVLSLSRQGAAYEDEKDAAFAGRIVSPKYKAVQVTPLVYIPWFQATYVVDIEGPKKNACDSGKMLV